MQNQLQPIDSKLIVTKFGGSSLASIEKIKSAAKKVISLKNSGHQVIVVVSAMAGETERLINLGKEFNSISNSEYDVIVSSGEQVSSALMVTALKNLKQKAISLQGWQIPIVTDNNHGKSRINHIDCNKIQSFLKQDFIVVIPGFQGISTDNKITTLGRGGSDTTAVALAAVLKAKRCYLYKDTDGILSTNPNIIKNPTILNRISVQAMLESASLGAEVLHPRATEIALNNKIDLNIIPTFINKKSKGTFIGHKSIEHESISNIVCNDNEAKIYIHGIPNSPVITMQIFEILSKHNINIDMVLQNRSINIQEQKSNLTFTTDDGEAEMAIKLIKKLKHSINFEYVDLQPRISKVSIIGSGLRGHASVATTLYKTLAQLGICDQGMITTELKISILVSSEYSHELVKKLHGKFFN